MILRSGLNTEHDNREMYWGERRLPYWNGFETEDERKERFETFLKRVAATNDPKKVVENCLIKAIFQARLKRDQSVLLVVEK